MDGFLLRLLLLLLLLLRVSLDVFKAYQPSRDRVVSRQQLCSTAIMAGSAAAAAGRPGPMPAAPPWPMPPAGAPGPVVASPSVFPPPTSSGACAPRTIFSGGSSPPAVEEGLVGHDEEESRSIVWAHCCYELSLLLQRPSKTKHEAALVARRFRPTSDLASSHDSAQLLRIPKRLHKFNLLTRGVTFSPALSLSVLTQIICIY